MTGSIDDLVAQIGLGAEDAKQLRAMSATLEPCFAAIIDAIYTAVRAVMPATSKDHHELVATWLRSGLSGPWDAAFLASRVRIGRRHAELGVPLHCVVLAVDLVRTAYCTEACKLADPRPAIHAINKLLDLELAIMVQGDQAHVASRIVDGRRDQRTAMQTLSAGLAHELRNPINSASLQLEVLARRIRRAGGSDTLLEPAELARHELDRLDALVDDFMVFAEPAQLIPGRHDLAAIAHEVADLERPQAQRKHVALDAIAPHTEAIVDRAKVTRILRNLVRNAVEAVSAGGHVVIRVTRDDADVHLIVEDDGPGIPDAVRARMFEPFYSTKDAGTGLGMSIVQSLVALHGGTIAVACPGVGTRCDVTLPARRLQLDPS